MTKGFKTNLKMKIGVYLVTAHILLCCLQSQIVDSQNVYIMYYYHWLLLNDTGVTSESSYSKDREFTLCHK